MNGTHLATGTAPVLISEVHAPVMGSAEYISPNATVASQVKTRYY
jgi:hypothetical protein